MKIGKVDVRQKVLVVAEIGNNHEGKLGIAEEMIQTAAMCGVDAVKFQTFRTEHYVSKSDAARFNRLKSFELSFPQFERLSKLAHSLGLLFISTPFDLASAGFLARIVDAYKIASGDNNFYPLLRQAAGTGLPMIVSSGASDGAQIEKTVAFIRQAWKDENRDGALAILHCVSSYPAPPAEANLLSIPFLAETFGCTVGYSDHTTGNDAALLAVGLGARIVEKHFTLDKQFSDFRDHQLSADPPEMKDLVQRIRQASAMLGVREKRVQACEQTMTTAIRRSIVAAKDLPAGHRIEPGDLTWIRPAGGLAPGQEDLLLHKKLKHGVAFGEQVLATDVEDSNR
jgi:sialic acid synthase SpsE